MAILVTGGTGLVGRALVTRLLEENHDVVILTRNPFLAKKQFNGRGPRLLQGSPEHFQISSDLRDEITSVISLAGESVVSGRWSVDKKALIRRSRIDGNRNLVRIFSNSNLKSFVTASAIGFYGDRDNEILEESSNKGEGFLSDVCQEWEDSLIGSDLDCRKTAIRLGLVLARNGGALKKLLPIFRAGLGGPIGSGRQWMSWIHVDDLVEIFLEAALDPGLAEIVNGVSPNPVTNLEFTHMLAKATKRPAFFRVPTFPLKFALGEMSQTILASQRVLPKILIDQKHKFKYPSLLGALQSVV